MKQNTRYSDPNDEGETRISCGGLSLSFGELEGFDKWLQDDDIDNEIRSEYVGYFALGKHHDVDEEEDEVSHSDIADSYYIDDEVEAESFDHLLQEMSQKEQEQTRNSEDVAVLLVHKMSSCGPATPASEFFETHGVGGDLRTGILPVHSSRLNLLPALLKVLRQMKLRPKVELHLPEEGKDPFTLLRIVVVNPLQGGPLLRLCKSHFGFSTPNIPWAVKDGPKGMEHRCKYEYFQDAKGKYRTNSSVLTLVNERNKHITVLDRDTCMPTGYTWIPYSHETLQGLVL